MSKKTESHPLRVFRDRAGLLQGDVARATGMHIMTISSIERRVRECGRGATIALLDQYGPELDAAGVTAEDLLRGRMSGRRRGRRRGRRQGKSSRRG